MNAREERFCNEYIVDLNATAAARRAGYKPGTAQNARQWITEGKRREKPDVRARVEQLQAKQAKRTKIKSDRVLRELEKIAFADASKFLADDGSIDTKSNPEDQSTIACIKVTCTDAGSETVILVMADKIKALVLLGKHLGLFPKTARITVELPQIIDQKHE